MTITERQNNLKSLAVELVTACEAAPNGREILYIAAQLILELRENRESADVEEIRHDIDLAADYVIKEGDARGMEAGEFEWEEYIPGQCGLFVNNYKLYVTDYPNGWEYSVWCGLILVIDATHPSLDMAKDLAVRAMLRHRREVRSC
jgi:hypothetical protein